MLDRFVDYYLFRDPNVTHNPLISFTSVKANELASSIYRANVGEVLHFLVHTNPVILRSILNYLNKDDALRFTIRVFKSAKHVRIFKRLLNARDLNGNYLINITARTEDEDSLGSLIIRSPKINNRQVLSLLRSLIYRNIKQKRQRINFLCTHEDGAIQLFRNALRRRDPELIELLLSVTHRDGLLVFPVNDISSDKTTLDLALAMQCPENILEVIINAGGYVTNHKSFSTMATEYLQKKNLQLTSLKDSIRNMLLPIKHRIVQENIAAINRFNQDKQNTHDHVTAVTVKNSILYLHELYQHDLSDTNVFADIKHFLESYNYSTLTINQNLAPREKKQMAIAFLHLMRVRQYCLHAHTQLTNQQILALVWHAVNDDAVENFPDDIKTTIPVGAIRAPAYLVELKKASLIEKFIEGYLEYRQDNNFIDVCVGGAIHILIASLNHAHCKVLICSGEFSIMPAANEVPKSILRKLLLEKPMQEQRQIISSWSSLDEKSVATEFKLKSVDDVKNQLIKQFGELLPQDKITNIIGEYEYFPMPVIHRNLDNVVRDIEAIPIESNGERLTQLKKLAKHAYDMNTRTFDEEYQLLDHAYQGYQNEAKLQVIKRAVYDSKITQLISSQSVAELQYVTCQLNQNNNSETLLAEIKTLAMGKLNLTSQRFGLFKRHNKDLEIYKLLADLDKYSAHQISDQLAESLKMNKLSMPEKINCCYVSLFVMLLMLSTFIMVSLQNQNSLVLLPFRRQSF